MTLAVESMEEKVGSLLNIKCWSLAVSVRTLFSKCLEPRSISSLSSVIVRVNVMKRTVGDSDSRFNNLSRSHLQSQSDIVSSVDGIFVSGY